MLARDSRFPAYVRQSILMTLWLVWLIRWRTRAEPINPAPPVIKNVRLFMLMCDHLGKLRGVILTASEGGFIITVGGLDGLLDN